MPKIYHRLYDAAKLDALSAEILNKNNLCAPAIYHCAQAVEKCLKATYAYYMMKIDGMNEREIDKKFSKEYGHDLQKSCEGIIRSLLKLRYNSEVKPDDVAQEELSLVKPPSDMSYSIRNFDKIINGLYEKYREIIDGKFDSLDLDEQDQITVRELLDQNYVKYIVAVMNLSAFLTPFEVYSRYPMNGLSNNNISLLSNAKTNQLSIIYAI